MYEKKINHFSDMQPNILFGLHVLWLETSVKNCLSYSRESFFSLKKILDYQDFVKIIYFISVLNFN